MKLRRRKRKIPRVWLLFIAVVAFVAAVIVVQIERNIKTYVQIQAEQVTKNFARETIAESFSDYISENDFTYSDFAEINYSDGRPVSIEAVTGNISRLQSGLAAEINSRFKKENKVSAKIPIGSISGSYLLSGRGADVNVRICQTGSADVKLKSTFDSAGFNQTRHRIYAEISADFVSYAPLFSYEVRQESEFLIAETVIVGDVPDYALRAWNG